MRPYAQDSRECAEIARHQAFRDLGGLPRTRTFRRHSTFRSHSIFLHPHDRESQGELEFRYRRICMLARGYELVPLDEDPDANQE